MSEGGRGCEEVGDGSKTKICLFMHLTSRTSQRNN